MASNEQNSPTINDFQSIQDFEDSAMQLLPKMIYEYYRGAACNETTLANNQSAFQSLRIRPRVMTDVSSRNLETTLLGQKVSFPIGISPTAMQKMAHDEGEIGTAQAAGDMGTIFILSAMSTISMEEVAVAAPFTIKWLQMCVVKDRNHTTRFVERAEKAGFKALVVTTDMPLLGIRYSYAKNKFKLPDHLTYGNFPGASLDEFVRVSFSSAQCWNDIKWLKSITKLPIVLKGILTKEDAKIAADVGADAILVSNHGARQLDTTPATIEALPEIVQAVGDRLEVYLDCGIRYGTDVFKALALGAKMVFVGRPVIWGLVNGGREGVKRVLNVLKSEFDTTLALAGATSVADIRKSMVVHESYYTKHFRGEAGCYKNDKI